MKKPEHLITFSKSQLAAGVATAIDFVTLIALVELVHVWYVLATAVAALGGAVSNFLLGRYWSFNVRHSDWFAQMKRYFLVAVGSLLLNTAGVFMLTAGMEFQYVVSKVLTAILIAVGFNYPLQRYYVFAKSLAN